MGGPFDRKITNGGYGAGGVEINVLVCTEGEGCGDKCIGVYGGGRVWG
jgi:hypothetical protein